MGVTRVMTLRWRILSRPGKIQSYQNFQNSFSLPAQHIISSDNHISCLSLEMTSPLRPQAFIRFILICNSFFLTVRQSAAVQRPLGDLRLPAGLLPGHRHPVLFNQRLFLQGQLGGSVRRPHLLPPLPATHPLLRLERCHGFPGQGGSGESVSASDVLALAEADYF